MSAVCAEVQRRIDELEVLPATLTVAMRCIELSKNRDAGIEDYAQLIQTDPALSSKILAVTNSSFFAVRHKATTIKQAVGLLGTECVRALVVSYCLAGLHNAWRLDPEDARAYWEASLCKAVAARLVAQVGAAPHADEAFTAGLFQDIGLGLFVALGGAEYGRLLCRSDLSAADLVCHEKARFGLDHAEAGNLIAERLGLPEPYPSAIRLHHRRGELRMALPDADLSSAVYVAALLPHDIRAWDADSMLPLDELLRREFSARWSDVAGFVRDVQTRLEELVGMLSLGTVQAPSLVELIQQACVENVRSTASLALYAHAFKQRSEELSGAVETLTGQQRAAVEQAARDPLTGLLNRDAFLKRGADLLARAAGTPVAVAVFDVDDLHRINEQHGHQCGDVVLQACARHLRQSVPSGALVGRWGGDELVVLLVGLSAGKTLATARRFRQALSQNVVMWRGEAVGVMTSAGLRWTARAQGVDLAALIEAADQAMYQARVLYDRPLGMATDSELIAETS